VRRQDIDVQERAVGEIVDVGESGDVGRQGAAADIDEDARRRERVAADLNLAGAGEATMPLVDGDVGIAPEPTLDAARGEAEHMVLALLHLLHVDADGALDSDAVVARAPRQVRGIGTGNQGLGGRAAGVDAGAAKAVPLEDGDPHVGGRPAMGQRWSGLAGADDDGVEVGHVRAPLVSAGHQEWPGGVESKVMGKR
jgi:hypothetical protein